MHELNLMRGILKFHKLSLMHIHEQVQSSVFTEETLAFLTSGQFLTGLALSVFFLLVQKLKIPPDSIIPLRLFLLACAFSTILWILFFTGPDHLYISIVLYEFTVRCIMTMYQIPVPKYHSN